MRKVALGTRKLLARTTDTRPDCTCDCPGAKSNGTRGSAAWLARIRRLRERCGHPGHPRLDQRTLPVSGRLVYRQFEQCLLRPVFDGDLGGGLEFVELRECGLFCV